MRLLSATAAVLLAATAAMPRPSIRSTAPKFWPARTSTSRSSSPASSAPDQVKVTVNGADHATAFGKAASFIEREDGKDQSALILRDVALPKPGTYHGARQRRQPAAAR